MKFWLDLSEHIEDPAVARQAGYDRQQQAILDLSDFSSIPTTENPSGTTTNLVQQGNVASGNGGTGSGGTQPAKRTGDLSTADRLAKRRRAAGAGAGYNDPTTRAWRELGRGDPLAVSAALGRNATNTDTPEFREFFGARP